MYSGGNSALYLNWLPSTGFYTFLSLRVSSLLVSLSLLITGANGFVGRVLCSHFADSGYAVRGSRRNHHQPDIRQDIKWAKIPNIGPVTVWSDALQGIAIIVHLAARVHLVGDRASDPLAEFRQVNVEGTLNLARQAADAGVKRFVFISSVKVNGESTAEDETFSDSSQAAPRDAYGVSKWEAEQGLQRIARETGMEVVIIRPPLVYGPRVKANFLRLLDLVWRGVPLPLGSVNNKRSLVYLGNLVDAIVACVTHPKAAGQTFLVSDGEDVSTPELIRRMAHAMGKPARLLPFPPALLRAAGKVLGKEDEVGRLLDSLVIDSSKIRRELGWKPPFTMEEGLRETAAWYRQVHGG